MLIMLDELLELLPRYVQHVESTLTAEQGYVLFWRCFVFSYILYVHYIFIVFMNST